MVNNQCLISHSQGDLEAALPCYRRARELFHELGEPGPEAVALNNISYAYYGRGEPQAAIDHYRRALEIRRGLGDRSPSPTTVPATPKTPPSPTPSRRR